MDTFLDFYGPRHFITLRSVNNRIIINYKFRGYAGELYGGNTFTFPEYTTMNGIIAHLRRIHSLA